jgi:hypothetical protein
MKVHRFRVQRSRLGTKTAWTTPKPAEAVSREKLIADSSKLIAEDREQGAGSGER